MDVDAGTQVRTGRCADHGTVRAVREWPRPQWPFVVYLWRRATAARAPFTCPDCGRPVTDVEKS
jgi:hypothetical protein